jgi:hypothetical protein
VFSETITPIEDGDGLRAMVDWVIPVMSACKARSEITIVCDEMFSIVRHALGERVWMVEDNTIQESLAELVDAAAESGWFRDMEFISGWIVNVLEVCPVPAHADAARHLAPVMDENVLEPVWKAMHGGRGYQERWLSALKQVITDRPALADSCRPAEIVEAIRSCPLALPAGAEVLAVVIGRGLNVDAPTLLAEVIAALGPRWPFRDIIQLDVPTWAEKAADAVFALAEAAIARTGDRTAVVQAMQDGGMSLTDQLPEASARENWPKAWHVLCVAYLSGERPPRAIQYCFRSIARWLLLSK